jgi:hypothetical protein
MGNIPVEIGSRIDAVSGGIDNFGAGSPSEMTANIADAVSSREHGIIPSPARLQK